MIDKLKTTVLVLVLSATSYVGFAQNTTTISKKIEKIIAKKRSYNKNHSFGYRIQLYNGNEQKAKQYRERFKIEFPGVYSKLVYNAPEWKIQVGNYKTKLDADRALIRFREKFYGIIVIPIKKLNI